jgi:DNA-damage-inducible protein D
MNSTIAALDSVKKESPSGGNYWMARDIMRVLGYTTWERFEDTIKRAVVSCEKGGAKTSDHFLSTAKMVEIGSSAKRSISDWFLTRYACYLIAMNGDVAKPEIAESQRYFAIQTRNQELTRELKEEEKRFSLRQRVTDGTKRLSGMAKRVGVQNYAMFHDAGYRGLYSMGLIQIKTRKGLKKTDHLYDHAGSAELAANEFRITQTEESLRKNILRGQQAATAEHHRIGAKVRQTIIELGNTLPENLPAAKSLKKIESEKRKALKKPPISN